jgi:hypothetical protein
MSMEDISRVRVLVAQPLAIRVVRQLDLWPLSRPDGFDSCICLIGAEAWTNHWPCKSSAHQHWLCRSTDRTWLELEIKNSFCQLEQSELNLTRCHWCVTQPLPIRSTVWPLASSIQFQVQFVSCPLWSWRVKSDFKPCQLEQMWLVLKLGQFGQMWLVWQLEQFGQMWLVWQLTSTRCNKMLCQMNSMRSSRMNTLRSNFWGSLTNS